jgi:site-specific recombinase XerD
VCLLYSTGCRVSEIAGLNRDDIDLRNRECSVLGKGNKERKVFFDSVAAMVIADYLKERSDDLPALFIGKGTHRLQPGGIRLMLHRVQANAHIDTNVHPHRFRRTLATNLTSRGMPVQEVARILGHEKLDTTLKYICLDDKEIKHSYNKFM